MIIIQEDMSPNVKIVLSILQDEIDGNVKSAINKMHPNYSMTWMYKTKNGTLFPSSRPNFKAEMNDIYAITGRDYDIRHITEADNVVMVELIESYPDPKTGEEFRTPLVLVLEIENEKIKTGRHYCDPQIPYLHLSKDELVKIYK
ncbi:MAG: nuclear transport factor 2 family protein [Patescibacteria group bacterium]